VRGFLAGARGVIGRRLVPLLVAEGHEVAGMTGSPGNAEPLRELGAEPVVVDAYDAEALREAVVGFDTDLAMHQLTDLPDDASTRPPAARSRHWRRRAARSRSSRGSATVFLPAYREEVQPRGARP
jgi:uncharacterized protein YbjT (DUF2867 family)